MNLAGTFFIGSYKNDSVLAIENATFCNIIAGLTALIPAANDKQRFFPFDRAVEYTRFMSMRLERSFQWNANQRKEKTTLQNKSLEKLRCTNDPEEFKQRNATLAGEEIDAQQQVRFG